MANMDSDDRFNDFLVAVENLRGDDTGVRTTSHTSSVSADGWTTGTETDPSSTQA